MWNRGKFFFMIVIALLIAGCEPATPERVEPAFEPAFQMEGEYVAELTERYETIEQQQEDLVEQYETLDEAYASIGEEQEMGPEIARHIDRMHTMREQTVVHHQWMQDERPDGQSMMLHHHGDHHSQMERMAEHHRDMMETHQELAGRTEKKTQMNWPHITCS